METIANNNTLPLDADNMPIALLQLDSARCIQAMNTSAETLFGISRQVAQGRALGDVLYHDCALFELLDRAEGSVARIRAPIPLLAGPGMSKQTGLHASISTTDDKGFALVLGPAPADGKTEGEAAGLAAFGRILGHEVKNPLAGLSGATQLLLRNARPDQKELLNLVLAESARITRLADKLSAFELFSSPRLAPCNVHETLERVIRSEELAFGGKVTFTRNFDPSLPDLLADSDHVHEALQNIIRNGAEAACQAGAPGHVALSTRFSLDQQNMKQAGKAATRSIKISICDNGQGIDSKDQQGIFEMFRTTKQNGSGLGLTIANQIITAHGGHIKLESHPGETLFHIYLPIAKAG